MIFFSPDVPEILVHTAHKQFCPSGLSGRRLLHCEKSR